MKKPTIIIFDDALNQNDNFQESRRNFLFEIFSDYDLKPIFYFSKFSIYESKEYGVFIEIDDLLELEPSVLIFDLALLNQDESNFQDGVCIISNLLSNAKWKEYASKKFKNTTYSIFILSNFTDRAEKELDELEIPNENRFIYSEVIYDTNKKNEFINLINQKLINI